MAPQEVGTFAEQTVEFSPGKDPYIKARKKGATRWILAHILFHH